MGWFEIIIRSLKLRYFKKNHLFLEKLGKNHKRFCVLWNIWKPVPYDYMIVCFSAGLYVVLIFAVSSQMQNIPYKHLHVNSKSSSVIKQTAWADSCNLHQTNWQFIHSSIPFFVSFIWFLGKKFFYKIFKLMTEILCQS